MRAPSIPPTPPRAFPAARALVSAAALALALALSPAPLPAAPALAPALAAPAPAPKKSDPEAARLREQVERLRSEHRLAGSKAFYLRLDASGSRLALMLQGVALDDYAARSVEWGVPEVFFVNRRTIPWPPEPIRTLTAAAIRGYMRWEDRRFDPTRSA